MQLFISDLHLCPTRPATTAAFRRFVHGPARSTQTLWILGDLFEYWAGDDDLETPFNAEIAAELGGLTASGVEVQLIPGNRDFLLGAGFTASTGVVVRTEPVRIELAGVATLLLHGDSLCTDDVAYQQFRTMVRNPAWQAQFLTQPLAVRKRIAEDLRERSEMSKQEKAQEIMDVNAQAVADCFTHHGVNRIIHGHTHRPARHEHLVAGRTCERWVLPDWHDDAVWLQADAHGVAEHREGHDGGK